MVTGIAEKRNSGRVTLWFMWKILTRYANEHGSIPRLQPDGSPESQSLQQENQTASLSENTETRNGTKEEIQAILHFPQLFQQSWHSHTKDRYAQNPIFKIRPCSFRRLHCSLPFNHFFCTDKPSSLFQPQIGLLPLDQAGISVAHATHTLTGCSPHI